MRKQSKNWLRHHRRGATYMQDELGASGEVNPLHTLVMTIIAALALAAIFAYMLDRTGEGLPGVDHPATYESSMPAKGAVAPALSEGR